MSIPSQSQAAERTAPEATWARFLSRLLVAGALGLLAVGVLNLVVNPDGIYPVHLMPQLTWGTRPLKAAMLKTIMPPPQALILGSSRVMELPPAEVERATGLRTFNAGVDSAKAEDFYVMLRYAVETAHLHPRLLILGCDVEAFHNQEPPHYYLQQPSFLATFMKQGVPRDWRWQQFTRLLSHQQAELSLVSLYKMAHGDSRPLSHTEPDGHIYFDEWERQRAAGEFNLEREIRTTLERFRPRYDNFTGLSQERLDYFNATLEYAHDHRMEVVVFMPPVHPEIEHGLRAHGYEARKQEVTAALEHLCAAWGVPFRDMSSSQSFGGDDSHFYDGVHYDGKLASLLVSRLLPVSAHAVQ